MQTVQNHHSKMYIKEAKSTIHFLTIRHSRILVKPVVFWFSTIIICHTLNLHVLCYHFMTVIVPPPLPPPKFSSEAWLDSDSVPELLSVIVTVGWESACDWMSTISWLLIVSLWGSTHFQAKIFGSLLPLFNSTLTWRCVTLWYGAQSRLVWIMLA